MIVSNPSHGEMQKGRPSRTDRRGRFVPSGERNPCTPCPKCHRRLQAVRGGRQYEKKEDAHRRTIRRIRGGRNRPLSTSLKGDFKVRFVRQESYAYLLGRKGLNPFVQQGRAMRDSPEEKQAKRRLYPLEKQKGRPLRIIKENSSGIDV